MTRILAADIGGTNSRFGYFVLAADNTLSLKEVSWLTTGSGGSLGGQLAKLYALGFPLPASETDIAVFAVAGPVEEGKRCKLPLAGWEIDLDLLAADFPLPRAMLINDFYAQALAVTGPPGQEARLILDGSPGPQSPVAVIGAGTGLGKALLITGDREKAQVIASEGGHADFPFGGGREQEYQTYLMNRLGEKYLSGNTVVSGPGLSYLYEFLNGEELPPSQVVKKLPEYPETHAWFTRFYARLCRNYVLDTLALGGLYIAGGVAARAPELLTHPAFAEEFRHSPTMGHLLNKVPVRLINDENSGLWGAAIQAHRLIVN